MILVLRTILLLGLIWALTSFGFTAAALAALFGEPSHIEETQIYGVAAMSATAAVVGLALAALIAMRLAGRRAYADLIAPRGLMVIAACLAGISAWSFAISLTDDQQGSFFLRFVAGARFEFLVLGLAALVMALRKA
jgi:hypothetical protein